MNVIVEYGEGGKEKTMFKDRKINYA